MIKALIPLGTAAMLAVTVLPASSQTVDGSTTGVAVMSCYDSDGDRVSCGNLNYRSDQSDTYIYGDDDED